jgi:hypothetical protein
VDLPRPEHGVGQRPRSAQLLIPIV